MNRLSLVLWAALVAVPFSNSVSAHSFAGNANSGPGSMMAPGMGMMGNYSDEQREQFNQSFQEMQRLMERIHQTDDPAEHDRLMHEHMHQLQGGMMMMHNGWMPGPGGQAQGMDSDDWRRNMEQRMFMMQMMLNQVIERDAEQYSEDE